jgi:apolipoprotein N-acyltransferase
MCERRAATAAAASPQRTAIWSAVLTGATVVRATGQGISSVIDGAGRVLAQASSAEGPVVLVVDAPIPSPT